MTLNEGRERRISARKSTQEEKLPQKVKVMRAREQSNACGHGSGRSQAASLKGTSLEQAASL